MKNEALHSTQIYTIQEKCDRHARKIKYYIDGNGCYICNSHAKDKDGYPRISRGKQFIRGHRYVYSIFHGDIPKGMVVMHTCDNPGCINPVHLKLGTHKENMNDRSLKGRTPKGSKHPHSQFKNDYDVYTIKFISDETHQELAKKYNVSVDTIKSIRLGKSWKWLTIDHYQKDAA